MLLKMWMKKVNSVFSFFGTDDLLWHFPILDPSLCLSLSLQVCLFSFVQVSFFKMSKRLNFIPLPKKQHLSLFKNVGWGIDSLSGFEWHYFQSNPDAFYRHPHQHIPPKNVTGHWTGWNLCSLKCFNPQGRSINHQQGAERIKLCFSLADWMREREKEVCGYSSHQSISERSIFGITFPNKHTFLDDDS